MSQYVTGQIARWQSVTVTVWRLRDLT